MPRIRFVNQYAGIIGGIERYMERTARLLRAEGIEKNEVDIFSWVHQGDTISEIIDKGGYF